MQITEYLENREKEIQCSLRKAKTKTLFMYCTGSLFEIRELIEDIKEGRITKEVSK